jgi:hypothetical protein
MNITARKVLTACSLGIATICTLPATKAHAQYDNQYISYNDFYQDLAPYGQWIDDPTYGYVWSPNVDGSFRPYYSDGYWAMTDYGNTWVSNYAWGWACFHYGRWTYDSYYGWLWIPGNDWGPAWVSWRSGDGYYGWAPLGPGYNFDASVGYSCPSDWWVFIPPQYIYGGNYYHYWYGPRGNSEIIHNTEIINNTYVYNHVTYVTGPRAHEVEEYTHKPVQVFKINNSNNPSTRVHDGTIRMYRPAQVSQAPKVNGQRPTPPNLVNAPQRVRTPQAMNTGQPATPQFRDDMNRTKPQQTTPGTGFNQTAEPVRPTRTDNNPYEWDNKQPERPATQPAPPPNNVRPEPQPQQQQPEPQRQPAQQPQFPRNEMPRDVQPGRATPSPRPAPSPRPGRR